MKYLFYLFIASVLVNCDSASDDTSDLYKIAHEFNKHGPRMIDSETRIDAIEIKAPNTIVYKYTLVNLLAKNVDTNEFKQALRPGIIGVIKVSPEMQKLKDQDAGFEYYYQDKNKQFIYNFKITAEDYR